jgi:hypothetical protein
MMEKMVFRYGVLLARFLHCQPSNLRVITDPCQEVSSAGNEIGKM